MENKTLTQQELILKAGIVKDTKVYISKIAKLYGAQAKSIRNFIAKHKILIKELDIGSQKIRNYIEYSDFETLIAKESFIKKCEFCKKDFIHKVFNQKFCSDKCIKDNHSYMRANKKARKTNIIQDGEYKGNDRSYAISKGRENAKKIKTCTTECLLKEYGDIE
jgi:hypothetical protein